MRGANEITFAAIDNHPKCSAQGFAIEMRVATVRWNCL
jgi:hypothetical protein